MLSFRTLDRLEDRYHRLEPFIERYGPEVDTPLPTLVLFHGCGGLRDHIRLYAETAAAVGLRVFVVDSLRPRGWGRAAAVSLVCTGVRLQGYERSGDVLAVLWGLRQRRDVDQDNIMLCGWSHGGWTLMDLMTQNLTQTGEAMLKDPDPHLLKGVKGLFLVYPYAGFPARSRRYPWVHKVRTLCVLASRDHLTPLSAAQRIFARLRDAENVEVETLVLDATHAFDEDTFGKKGIMVYDPVAVEASLAAMLAFADAVFTRETISEPQATPQAANG
jgi:dienelactone hydrolase